MAPERTPVVPPKKHKPAGRACYGASGSAGESD